MTRAPSEHRIGPIGRLGTACARHPWLTIAVWAAVVVAAAATALAGIGGQNLFDRLSGSVPSVHGESSEGADRLASGASTKSVTLLVHGVDPSDPELVSRTTALARQLAALPHTTVADPLAVPGGIHNPAVAPLVAKDGDGILVTATVTGVNGHSASQATLDRAQHDMDAAATDLRAAHSHATVEVGSTQLLTDSLQSISENDLRRGETVALPIALLVMLIVFGGFIAAGLPLIGAGASIVTSLGILLAFTYVTDIANTVINVVTAVGLGLSIDYGLLVVSRFREEYRAAVARGQDAVGQGTSREHDRAVRLAAIGTALDRAGRTVLFSGTTFAIASLGLLVFEPAFVRAVGIAAIAVTVVAMLSATTLIPAIFALTGQKLLKPGALTRLPLVGRWITRFGDVAPDEGFFSRLTRRVQRHPALVTLGCVLILLLLGSPVLTLNLANTSIDAVPRASSQYTFETTLVDEFPDAAPARVQLVATTRADLTTWSSSVARLDHVDSVQTPQQSGDAWSARVEVNPRDGVSVVREIRGDAPAFRHWVTGIDAGTVDLADSLARGAPWAVLIVALGTIALLFLMTGSLVVPLKALVASALSLGASLGLLVWGFQDGAFAGILGFDADHVYGVDVIVLVLALAFGFGLAMDYEMFILSRIKERVDAGTDGRESIALGLQRSGRIITSAALIIIVVFAGFATGDLLIIKQLGVALAFAVLIDATIVRCLLVPAFMTWQERIMWWAPRWMKRLHAKIGIAEG
ncbi:MMPL family transporter [Humibacter ginsenosidimutans]|uniref:MMPL family transporter n=1 Tax=Humibacter ginsenosidimutans TaxID=2599293 RepID=A0A5B8M381_9MICO|nr:MMPL family transporter [Humibacter ginsenosidimutans]QDZ14611.1 MMPL family transporter [Humibacter ginsenosidimutans]